MTTTINASTTAGLVQTADTSGVLALQTAGTTAVTVDASQNVGIGTASPTGKLHVSAPINTKYGTFDAVTSTEAYTVYQVGGTTYSQIGDASGLVSGGTAGNLAVRFSGAMVFSGGANERMRIDSSGNVGIGGTPSGSYKLQLIGTAATTFGAWGVTGTTTAGAYAQFVNTGNTTIFGVESSAGASLCGGTSAYASIFGTSSAAPVQFVTNNSTRATILSTGELVIGTTSIVGAEQVGISFADATKSGLGIQVQGSTSGAGFVAFRNSGGTLIGSIARVTTTNAVVYNTTSDQRLKSNIANADIVLDKLMNVKVRQFDWTEGNLHQDYGFIAQELEPTLPGLVTKGKTNEDMWQVDYSRLTPHLVKAIQEQQALITALTARITALEVK
jgi:hypothetical protein